MGPEDSMPKTPHSPYSDHGDGGATSTPREDFGLPDEPEEVTRAHALEDLLTTDAVLEEMHAKIREAAPIPARLSRVERALILFSKSSLARYLALEQHHLRTHLEVKRLADVYEVVSKELKRLAGAFEVMSKTVGLTSVGVQDHSTALAEIHTTMAAGFAHLNKASGAHRGRLDTLTEADVAKELRISALESFVRRNRGKLSAAVVGLAWFAQHYGPELVKVFGGH